MKEVPVIIVQLVHIQGPLKGQIQEFTEPVITVGRHPSCQVQFPTDLTTLSRNHTELVREGNRYKVVDRSTNGTFVNGKRVTEAFLKDGDVIMFTEGGPKVSFLARITDAVKPAQAVTPPAPEQPRETVLPEPPAAPAPPVRPAPPVEPVLSAPPAPPKEQAPPVKEPPKPAAPPRQVVQKVQVPLMIQFGPVLKSFKELPIVIGKTAGADFALNHPALADQHAQVFFSQDAYWVRDLTGRNLVTVNGQAIGFEAPLKAQDIIALAPGGPSMRFLGEGRLAEYEEAPAEEASPVEPARPKPEKKEKASKSIFDIFKK